MRIALDAMGGDYAPGVVIEGALLAKKELSSDVQIILIGDQEAIKAELAKRGSSTSEFEIVHASEVISMAEHPAKAVAAKQDSSIVVGYKMLMDKKTDAFCSAGNTGAMLVASMFTIKAIEGVIRPGIAGFIPKSSGKYGVVFDVGANSEVKPEMLAQFAQMGSFYVENYLNINNPTVGLLNLGEEEEKGTAILQAAHQLIKQNNNINFIGNIEGRDVLTDKVDLIVCDGYVGNVVLKMGESLYNIFTERGFKDEFVDMFNWQLVGGSPILGVNGTAVIGHGSSNDLAISNMIKFTVNFTKAGITEKIKNAYSC